MTSLLKKTIGPWMNWFLQSCHNLFIVVACLVIQWLRNVLVRNCLRLWNATSFVIDSIVYIRTCGFSFTLWSLQIDLATALKVLFLGLQLIRRNSATILWLIFNGLKLRGQFVFHFIVGLILVGYNKTFCLTIFLLCFAFFLEVVPNFIIV